MNKQMQIFYFSPINLMEGKWLLAVSSFECTNSVFNITDENNSLSLLYQVIGTLNQLKKLLTN